MQLLAVGYTAVLAGDAAEAGALAIARGGAPESAARADGAALVATPAARRRAAPPSRAAIRLSAALAGVAEAQPIGRLCIAASGREQVAHAARYLAPVVLEIPPDGSGPAAG